VYICESVRLWRKKIIVKRKTSIDLFSDPIYLDDSDMLILPHMFLSVVQHKIEADFWRRAMQQIIVISLVKRGCSVDGFLKKNR
jgi:hypothetical protein